MNWKAIASSWARSFGAGLIACYISGITDPKILLSAGLGALAPVVLRFLNPKDEGFGLIQTSEQSER